MRELPVQYFYLQRKHLTTQSLAKSIQENPNYGPAYSALGNLLIKKKDWKGALEDFAQSNALNPFNPEIHKGLAMAYEMMGNQRQADFEKSVVNDILNR